MNIDSQNGSRTSIDPSKVHPSLGAKFSPNLHSYLTSPDLARLLPRMRVYRDEETGALWLGYVFDGCFTGTLLGQVLTKGRKAAVYSHPEITPRLREIEDFWQRYVVVGRCAIDTGHSSHFIGGETRWVTIGPRERECTWCGARQVLSRWTESVDREAWEAKP